MQKTQDVNVVNIVPLVPPRVILEEFPQTEKSNRTVVEGRAAVRAVLEGRDPRMLIVAGPCSIHDEDSAWDYASRLAAVAEELRDRLVIVMRVYFEKPRTTIGWKGLINDPYMNGTFDMEAGLRKARRLLLKLGEAGLPAACEMLDPITPQYIDDLITWASLGARTTESQTHRQMASGLSMPMGYKNATDGDIQIALDAMKAARSQHSFLGIDRNGQTCVFQTRGNPLGHLILRGGRSGPNYDSDSVQRAGKALEEAGLLAKVMVDCSHDNSRRDFRRQEIVWKDVLQQMADGSPYLIGAMIESNLCEGNQAMSGDPGTLRYGVSVTDACMGWEKTEELLRLAHQALAAKKALV